MERLSKQAVIVDREIMRYIGYLALLEAINHGRRDRRKRAQRRRAV